MDIKVTISVDPQDLRNLLESFGAEAPAGGEQPVDEKKAKSAGGRKKKTKTRKTTDAEAAEEPGEATYEQVRDAVVAVARAHGRDAAARVLKKFGAGSISELGAEQYASVVAACEDAVKS